MRDFDLSSVPPAHPVCPTLVEVPTVRMQPKGLGYPRRPAEFEGRNEVVVQWYCDATEGPLKDLQFAFPVTAKPDAVQWFGHPERYRVVMLAPLRNWKNPEVIRQFTKDGAFTPDSHVIYLITSELGLDDRRGGTMPSAFLTGIALLGDPAHGVIQPREYIQWNVADEEVAKLAKK
jgi:hypothetical protein